MTRCILFGFSLALTVVLTSVAQATKVEVHNLSNSTVYVAGGYNYDDHRISAGWTIVRPGEEKTISAPDDSDLYLRVQTENGGAVNFPAYQSILYFPVHSRGFTVNRTDVSDVYEFRIGSNTPRFARRNNIPQGWESKGFFRVGRGSHHLNVVPPR